MYESLTLQGSSLISLIPVDIMGLWTELVTHGGQGESLY